MSECHVMLDLETMDVKTSAIILSLAAICFDPTSGKHIRTIYRKIDLDSYQANDVKNQFTFSGETMKWWMNQCEEARKEAFGGNDRVPLKEALNDFVLWCRKVSENKTIKIWSHGSVFDVAIITYALNKTGIAVPWTFPNIRDTRTLYEIYTFNLNTVGAVPVDGTLLPAHHPLGDCARQIEGIRLSLAKFN